ncbi:MAG: ECF-type sigma factor [Pirellulales bacterium]
MDPECDSFQRLLARVRAGESSAAADLVRLFEPEVRRTIRVRLTDPRLRRVIDSMDVCQSVLANFFIRAGLGEFDLRSPEDLVALLVAMVRNKVVDQTRRQNADRRDVRRFERLTDSRLAALPESVAGPEQVAADRDLLREVSRRLSADERYLAEQRSLGREWQDLADELSAGPEALRKKLSRALDRVARDLGLEEFGG